MLMMHSEGDFVYGRFAYDANKSTVRRALVRILRQRVSGPYRSHWHQILYIVYNSRRVILFVVRKQTNIWYRRWSAWIKSIELNDDCADSSRGEDRFFFPLFCAHPMLSRAYNPLDLEVLDRHRLPDKNERVVPGTDNIKGRVISRAEYCLIWLGATV